MHGTADLIQRDPVPCEQRGNTADAGEYLDRDGHRATRLDAREDGERAAVRRGIAPCKASSGLFLVISSRSSRSKRSARRECQSRAAMWRAAGRGTAFGVDASRAVASAVASPTLTLASVPATPDASRTPTPACLFAARRTRLASSDLQSERTTHLTADARPPSTARREAHSRECQKDCLGNRPHPALGGCGASYRLACRRPTQQGSRTQGSAGSFRRRRAGHPS